MRGIEYTDSGGELRAFGPANGRGFDGVAARYKDMLAPVPLDIERLDPPTKRRLRSVSRSRT
ncbi:MAG: hypothetical protein E5X69_24940 [Mesorhizobium sp.]|nr:MAG: hypothetical protein E5X69_24940 [Mesorhizobium sp.]